jgi:AcrR family transcriptional regulator
MARHQEILRVAERLFYERGYGAVGVDLIGAESGVTGPAIYSHFSGKAEILAALFDGAMDRMLVLAGPVRDDPVDELRHLAKQHAQFVLENRELLTVYTREDRALPDEARRRASGVGRLITSIAGSQPSSGFTPSARGTSSPASRTASSGC